MTDTHDYLYAISFAAALGCGLYLLGNFGVTAMFNVPMNDVLARVDAGQPEATEQPHHEQTIERLPGAVEKLWWGEKVMGVRVALARIDARTLNDLLCKAWRLKAPKSLLRGHPC